MDGEEVEQKITKAYEEVVHWHRNLFKIPSGKQGKTFVSEMAGLFQSYADGSAMKAAMVLLDLLLQKPHLTSKTKDHINCIEMRYRLWKEGNVEAPFEEGRVIQRRLQPNMRANNPQLARRFAKRMGEARIREAVRLISGGNTKVLPLNDQVDEHRTVWDILIEKHPAGEGLQSNIVSAPTGRGVHPIIFEEITALSIMEAALYTMEAQALQD